MTQTDELIVDATIGNIDAVTEYVEERLDAMGCSRKSRLQIAMAIDEIFSNICSYAYGEHSGHAKVRVEELAQECSVRITFEDNGVPFDPLNHSDPDITASLEERGIGGLGIFMVKRTMDDVRYAREGDSNVLTVVKSL